MPYATFQSGNIVDLRETPYVVETPEASNDSSRARSPFPCLPSTTIYSFLQLKQLHTNLLCCASSQLGLGLIQFSVFFLVLRCRWGRKGLIRFLLFGRMLSPVVISLLEVALECPGQEHWDQKSKQIYGVIDCIGCCQYPAKPYPCLLLVKTTTNAPQGFFQFSL